MTGILGRWIENFTIDIAISEIRELLSELRMIHVQELICCCFILIILIIVVAYFYKRNKILKRQVVSIILLGLYLELLFAFTILLRIPRLHCMYKLQLFWSWKHILQNRSFGLLIDNILNLLILFPVGCFVCLASKRNIKIRFILLTGVIISGSIELFQLVSFRGYFEWDDIFHNTLSCLIGYWMTSKLVKSFKARNIGRNSKEIEIS